MRVDVENVNSGSAVEALWARRAGLGVVERVPKTGPNTQRRRFLPPFHRQRLMRFIT